MYYTGVMAQDMLTVRIDRRVRRRLAQLAQRRGRTSSELARAAIEAWLDEAEGSGSESPYEAILDLIGCVDGGDPYRSTRRGRDIADMLRAKRRDRRRR